MSAVYPEKATQENPLIGDFASGSRPVSGILITLSEQDIHFQESYLGYSIAPSGRSNGRIGRSV